MSTYFDEKKSDCMFVCPANTDAIIECQRFGCADRTTGSFYLSGFAQRALEFLDNLQATYLVDVGLSYFLCEDLFRNLIANCSNLYKSKLAVLKNKLAFLKNILSSLEDDVFFANVSISFTGSNKYLHIDSRKVPYTDYFKYMILGEVTEIVIKKVSSLVYVIYLRPRSDVSKWTATDDLLLKWIGTQTRA